MSEELTSRAMPPDLGTQMHRLARLVTSIDQAIRSVEPKRPPRNSELGRAKLPRIDYQGSNSFKMAAVDQMAGYAAHLNANTPPSSKGKPVTEIAIFTLQPPYDQDHAAAASEFESQIVANCRPGASYAKGIRKIAWGFSLDDPKTFVWLLDWDKIEDHWDFWLTPGFPPVMGAIAKLFTPGRPLVRHYDFGNPGMLDTKFEFVKMMVWDDGVEGKKSGQAKRLGKAGNGALDFREAYAVDLDESTWWSTLLGFDSEKDAVEAKITPGPDAVSHVFRLRYAILE